MPIQPRNKYSTQPQKHHKHNRQPKQSTILAIVFDDHSNPLVLRCFVVVVLSLSLSLVHPYCHASNAAFGQRQ
jgi:hypothetical protein